MAGSIRTANTIGQPKTRINATLVYRSATGSLETCSPRRRNTDGDFTLPLGQFVEGAALMIEGDAPAAYPIGIDLVRCSPVTHRSIIALVHIGEIDIDTADFIDPF